MPTFWNSKNGNVGVFILLIVVFGLIIYLAGSGTLEKIGVERLDLTGGDVRDLKDAGTEGGGGAINTDTKGSGSKIDQPKSTSTPDVDPRNIPEGFTIEQLSPHFKKVRLSSVRGATPRSNSVISLSGSNIPEGESINITNWRIEGKKSSQFIPKAVNVYEPNGLTPETEIFLKRRHYVYIYSSESPIGKNLRLNKCIGFLENTVDFNPSLPRNCPRPDSNEVANFSDECYRYVRTLSSCELPESNILLPQNDYGCKLFLNNINYKGCFEDYRGEDDFLSREWRIWTGAKFFVSVKDEIKLFDSQGLLVDIRYY